ncbi:hypothetical protein PENSPDRAFT_689394 [Peniophora sp. CONT]|nr:hypothetical protein PENSPDRAFT_689394 [Peniophora sp. CONT]
MPRASQRNGTPAGGATATGKGGKKGKGGKDKEKDEKAAIGRPVKAARQRGTIMTFMTDYAGARKVNNVEEGKKVTREAAGAVLGIYGWDDPFRKLTQGEEKVLDEEEEAEPEDVDEDQIERAMRAQKKAEKAKKKAKKEGQLAAALTQSESEKRDAMALYVYKEVARILQYEHRKLLGDDDNGALKFDVPGWFRDMSDPPRRRPAYAIFEKLFWTEDMEAEVDRICEEEEGAEDADDDDEGENATPRAGVINHVASEHLKIAGEDVKEMVRAEREKCFKEEYAAWENKFTQEPESIEDAEEFAEEVNTVLEMIASYVAKRCSGLCVWYTAGPKGIYRAEGCCDVPGRTVKLFSDVKPKTHLGVAGQIMAQSTAMNEQKWGEEAMRVKDEEEDSDGGEDSTKVGEAEQGTVAGGSAKKAAKARSKGASPSDGSGPEATDDEEPSVQRPAAMRILSSPPTGDEESDEAPPRQKKGAAQAPVQKSIAAKSSSSAKASTRRVAPDAQTRGGEQPEPSTTVTSTKPRPRATKPLRTGDGTETPNTAPGGRDAIVNDKEGTTGGAAVGKPAARPTSGDRAREGSVQAEVVATTGNGITGDGEGLVTNAGAGQGKLDLGGGGLSASTSTAVDERLFSFEARITDEEDFDTKVYEKDCKTRGGQLDLRKPWFGRAGMTNFLIAVPKKLEGGVDVTLACQVANKYLDLESSDANEGAIKINAIEGGDRVPAYTVDLNGKTSRTSWNKRAQEGQNRTKALLDRDVNRFLPRQWVEQQPAGRRGDEGNLVLPAEASMDWEEALPAGIDGVRLLVVTLFCWGWDIKENEKSEEAAGWERLARDFIEVLDILAIKAGPYEAPSKDQSGEEGKRKHKPTEKGELWGNRKDKGQAKGSK